MIVAPLKHLDRYVAVHPRFAQAIAFVRRTALDGLQPGRYEILGDDVYVSIERTEGRGREGARLEAHRKYIDLQIALEGEEEIGWAPLASCTHPAGDFARERDIGFFEDRPDVWVPLPPGVFAVFFPEDAHAPLAGRGPLRKAIVKILV